LRGRITRLLGLEGIVSKRKGSPYRSGHSPDWLKMKNPNAPGGEARGRRGLGQRGVAMTAGITGAACDRLIAKALRQTSLGLAIAW
jgi:hypothetical protein